MIPATARRMTSISGRIAAPAIELAVSAKASDSLIENCNGGALSEAMLGMPIEVDKNGTSSYAIWQGSIAETAGELP